MTLESGYSNEMLEQCCRTEVHFEIWSIDILKALIKPRNTYLESPRYFAGPRKELEWCLHFYPKGDVPEWKAKFVSLHPVLIGNRSSNAVRVKFQISILDRDFQCENSQSFSVFITAGQLGKLPTFSEFIPISMAYLHNPIVVHSNVSVSYEEENFSLGYAIWPLLQDLESIYSDRKYSDVTLVINEKEMPVHKNILAGRSPVFSAMFDHEMEENKTSVVRIVDFESNIIEDFLLFLYSGKSKLLHESPFNWKAVADLLAAADKYQVLSLKNICAAHLELNLSVDNACEILSLADVHNVGILKKSAVNYINTNRLRVIDTVSWKEMLKTSPILVADLYLAKEHQDNN